VSRVSCGEDADTEGGFVAASGDIWSFGRIPGERAFDDARADAQPPGGEQAAQDPPADTAGQVDDSAGDDAGALDEQVAGGVQGDGEAGAVRVGAAGGLDRVSDGDPQDLVAGQQGVDLLGDPGRGPGTQYPAAQDRSSGRQAVR
jgi:hypothetical protein